MNNKHYIEDVMAFVGYDIIRKHKDLTIGVRFNPNDNKMDIVVYVGDVEVAVGHETYTFRTSIGTRWSITVDRDLHDKNKVIVEVKESDVTYNII